MIINGKLTTLIEVPTNEVPSGMEDAEVYSFNGHTFYRFNGKVYYDKYKSEEAGTGSQTSKAHLSAYNLRRSNFCTRLNE